MYLRVRERIPWKFSVSRRTSFRRSLLGNIVRPLLLPPIYEVCRCKRGFYVARILFLRAGQREAKGAVYGVNNPSL